MSHTDESIQAHAVTMPAIHPFEAAGLGKAPFRFLGVEHKTYQACADAPVQPGGSCDYCGTGLYDLFHVKGADGKRFVVGCDCALKIERKATTGLTYEQAKVFNAIKAAARKCANKKRHAREAVQLAELATLMADEAVRAALSAVPSSSERGRAKGETALNDCEWMIRISGVTGKLKTLKTVKAIAGL